MFRSNKNTIYVVLILMFLLSRSAFAGGNGRPDKPDKLPPQATRNPHYPTAAPEVEDVSPIGEQESPPTPFAPDVPPPCGYTDDVPCDEWNPPTQEPDPIRADPFAQPTVVREPTQEPLPPQIQTCNIPDDVALLMEAIAEGYSVIIVKDVLATSPNVIIIGQ
jgi:hypothetical protein